MLICVSNINVITLREKYLCLIEVFDIAHCWPGTSVPVRPVWHTGAQNWTLYYKYIYQMSFIFQHIRLKFGIIIAMGLPNNIYQCQLGLMSENKMAAI